MLGPLEEMLPLRAWSRPTWAEPATPGALGGIGGGQILGALVPALASAAGGVDWKVVVGQLVGGGVGGAILTIIAGMIKGAMAKS